MFDMSQLDETACTQMEGLVELLTTSGKRTLNPDIMKKFKKFCRISDAFVQHAFSLLMCQLAVNHAEVRLSAYQMTDALFIRSHLFRELLLENFDAFLERTVGTDKKKPLPPPIAAAENMRSSVYKSIQLWFDKFGTAYKKLALGYEFLKNCKNVDFDSIQATADLERRQKEDTERKLEENRKEKLDKVSKEYSESELDIQLCITEVENGLQLLMPRPDDFFILLSGDVGTSSELNSVATTLTSASSVTSSDSSKDNKRVPFIQNQSTEITGESEVDEQIECKHKEVFVHDVSHYTSPSNVKIDSVDIDSGIHTDSAIIPDIHKDISNDDTVPNTPGAAGSFAEDDFYDKDDDDFEEINDAENVFTQEHGLFDRKFAMTVQVGQAGPSLQETEDNRDLIQGVRDQYRLIKTKYLSAVKRWIQVMTDNRANTDKIKQMTSVRTKLEDAMKKCVELEIASSRRTRDDDTDSDEDDFEDVPEKEGYEEDIPEHVKMEAVMASTSKTSKATSKKKRTPKKPKGPAKSMRMKNVKQMARDLLESQRLLNDDDLDSALLKSQSGNKAEISEKSCIDDESRFVLEDYGVEPVASSSRPDTKFEPIKWKCRVALSDGSLCDRMDRIKCPFHGKVIGRDKNGQSTDVTDTEQLVRERIIPGIEHTGDNVAQRESNSRSKGKGKETDKGKQKAKKRKHSNLTDIKETKNSRSRIEAKIFKRSTLQKVNKALNEATFSKLSNKFSDQFNYSLK